jgi:ATP synthase protein I
LSTSGSQNGPNGDAGDEARLQALDARLRAATEAQAAREDRTANSAAAGYAMGNQVIALLIGGLAGGALIGWLIDRWLGSSPRGLLALMFLGTAAAFRNIIRLSSKRPE